ncbi:MAG: hypothetical protein ACOYVJ_01490 [Nitrospirota bacterium]
MSKKILFLIAVCFLSCGMMLLPSQGAAQNGFFCNGGFETGDLECWSGTGDVGVFDLDVISGYYTAFMTTAGGYDQYSPQVQLSENPAYNNLCTWLYSGEAYPVNVPQAVNVSFRVRYLTDEGPWNTGCTDPFDAKLATSIGTIELVDISTDGITPGPGASVRNMTTNTYLVPPVLPPFMCEVENGPEQSGLFSCETPVFEVRKRLTYASCEPVEIRFAICDHCDDVVDSAVFLDDVQITFEDSPGTGFWQPGMGGGGPIPCPPIEEPDGPTAIRGR